MTDIQDAIKQAQAVKRKYETELLEKKNVVGVGVGFETKQGKSSERIVIVVNVTQKVLETMLNVEDVIPYSLEGVPVEVVETGIIRASGD